MIRRFQTRVFYGWGVGAPRVGLPVLRPRAMVRIGLVVFGLGFILLSRVHSIAGFYAAVSFLAVGSSLSAFFPLTVALVNWFDRYRARALSFMSLGFAIGGMLVPVVA